MKKITLTNSIRILVQLAAFIVMPGLFIDTFMGIKAVFVAVISGDFTFSAYSFQLISIAAIFLVTIVAGRFFCGFLCSFGAMGDLGFFIGRSLKLPKIKVEPGLEKMLKSIKYLILVLIVGFVWWLGTIEIPDEYNPWTIFGMYSKVGSWPGFTKILTVGGALLIGIFIGSMFISRFFCRYLCPLGGIFSILSKLRAFKVKKPTGQCGGCKLCTANCPMALELSDKESVGDGDCINCLKCIDNCPKGNAHMMGLNNKKVVVIVAIICSAIMVGGYYFGISYAKNLASTEEVVIEEKASPDVSEDEAGLDSDSLTNEANDTYDVSKYTDGTYTGNGSGFRGSITVEVVVSGGLITDITVTSNNEDWQYFERAESTVISEIIDEQQPDVDAVSGATFSSNGIMEAVADALEVDFTNPNSTLESGHGGHGNH